MWRMIVLAGGVCVISIFVSPVAAASEGLEVSSSRINVQAESGQTRSLSYTVTNNSNSPIKVNLQVKQFSVDPNKETLRFTTPKYDWIEASKSTLSLAPNEKQPAQFTISIPQNAASQEYHFALIASTDIVSQEDTKTIQVAPLVYLYVDGKPIDRTTTIKADTRPGITMSSSIPYTFDIVNQGNIHLESDVSVTLKGPNWRQVINDQYKLVLPSQSRSIAGNVTAPYIPGVYTLTYTSIDDVTGKSTTTKRSVIIVPPWTISALILFVLVIIWGRQSYRKRKSQV